MTAIPKKLTNGEKAAMLAERVVRLETALQEIATSCGGEAANIARQALGVRKR